MTQALRTLAGLFSESWRTPSKCEGCGEEFNCGAKLSGCWCSEIELSGEMRGDLRANYSGCLCRTCLEKMAAKAPEI